MQSDNLDRFWDHLERQGVIDAKAHRAVLDSVSKTWKPLGRVLIELGFLSMKQLMRLLAKQADDPTAFLGSLAVREGFCTQDQIDQALRSQRNSTASAYALLVEQRGIAPEELFESTVSYIRHLETLVGALVHQN